MSMGWAPDFTDRVAKRHLTIGVIGLGYVGLPTAMGFHDAGFKIWGVDISPDVVATIRAGDNPTGDSQSDVLIPSPSTRGWNITTSFSESIPHCDVVIVTVPTPVTAENKPNLDFVIAAGQAVFDNVSRGSRTIVVLESTVYPGVTVDTWLPLINSCGLELGVDVDIAYCPERFDPGDVEHGVRDVARVIGSIDGIVGRDLADLYSTLTRGGVRYVGSIEVAEAAKVVENVQRDINIALGNELARIFPALGIDIEDVMAAAETKWNFMRTTPGVGVGGHCIPVDPYYLIQCSKEVGIPAELISSARAVNRSMPEHVADVLKHLLLSNGAVLEDSLILMLGWSYKPGIGDSRETPAAPLAASLKEEGVAVTVFDPYIRPQDRPEGILFTDDLDSSEGFDLVVLVTAHPECIDLDWEGLASRMRTPIVYDGRRCLDLEDLASKGWKVHAVGRPNGA